jgi:hypothetical protein
MDPNFVLARYAVERFLYRLSKSRHAERFVLKGAMLMLVWLGETLRPTRDLDLLGSGDLSEGALANTLAEICSVEVDPDGVEFQPETIQVEPIRVEDVYGGMRARMLSRLGNARLRLQIDVGVGDAVSPRPEWLDYPSLLGLPAPHVLAYRPETAIAEKLHAMATLGEANSRMRDFFDIDCLAGRLDFKGEVLARAIRETFARRSTPIPTLLPVALTTEFGTARRKQVQWDAFVRKGNIAAAPAELRVVVERIARFLAPVMNAAREGSTFEAEWPAGGAWAR